VPTFAEAGIANAESYTWHMVFAPSGTPVPVVTAINAALNQVAGNEAVQKRLTDLTMTVRSDTTPATATQWLNDQIAKWEPIIREAGIKIN